MNIIQIFITALFVILAMGCGELKNRDIADTIYIGGEIVTIDDKQTVAEARGREPGVFVSGPQ